MDWPLPQDYNEAIQNPRTSFADPELRRGEPVTNALGLPMPRSGGFADVYEIRCPASQIRWAVKCFTRPVADLRERYAEISTYLRQAQLPFSVDFNYLQKGITIQGEWYGIVKMDWIEGLLLNEFIRDAADRASTLEALIQVWLRMARRLREARLAHGDLQHGNVLLVPGSKPGALAIRLIDYDGMFVPALAERKPGEVGHPNYQHPLRASHDLYNLDIDRFPLLLVATVLRCLKVGGSKLWQRYDNGDNLLFREADLQAPAASALFHELWRLDDTEAHALVGHLMLASRLPPEQTPLLDELFIDSKVSPLSPDQEKQVETVLQSPPPLPPPRGGGEGGGRPPPVLPRYSPQPVDASFPVTPYSLAELAPETPSNSPSGEVAPIGVRTRLEAAARERQRRLILGALAVGSVTAVCVLIGLVLWATTGGSPPGANPAAPLTREKPTSGDKARVEITKEKPRVATGKASGQTPTDRNEQQPLQKQQRSGSPIKPPVEMVGEARAFIGHTGLVHAVAFGRDGQRVVSGSRDNTIRLWDVATGEQVQLFQGHTAEVSSVSLSRREDMVLSSSLDGTIRRWDVKTGKELARYEGHTSGIQDVVFSPDEQKLLSSSDDYTLRLWDVASGRQLLRMNHPSWVRRIAFSPDGRYALAGCADHALHMWNLTTGREFRYWLLGEDVFTCAFLPDGYHAVSGCFDRNIGFWDLLNAKELRQWQGHGARIWAVAVTADGRHAFSCGDDQTLRLWDLQTGQEIHHYSCQSTGVAVSSDGCYGLSGGTDGVVRLWRLPPRVQVAPGKAETPFEKPLIPSAAERTVAEKLIKQSYQGDFYRALLDPLGLAKKLLDKGKEAQATAAVRFVCWELAWKLAAGAGDLDLSIRIIDDLDYGFAIDAWKMRSEALELARRSALARPALEVRPALEAVADSGLIAVGDAWAVDAYRPALALLAVARSAAEDSRNSFLVKLVLARQEELERLQKEYERVDGAAQALAANPNDPAANLTLGKFECFQKEDWNKGVPMLARSGDSKLADLAQMDLAKPLDAKTLVSVGQSWWDLAEKESGVAKAAIQRWAKKWWLQALPGLSGSDKTAVEGKLKIVRESFEAKPGLVTELFDDGNLKHKVKIRIDYQVDFNWHLGAPDIGLPVDNFSIRWRGWLVPPRAGKYTLVITADDGARLFLDGKKKLDAWTSIGRHTVEVQLNDRPYQLRLEHHEGTGDAMMSFSWMQKGFFVEEPVPPEALFHDLQHEKSFLAK